MGLNQHTETVLLDIRVWAIPVRLRLGISFSTLTCNVTEEHARMLLKHPAITQEFVGFAKLELVNRNSLSKNSLKLLLLKSVASKILSQWM